MGTYNKMDKDRPLTTHALFGIPSVAPIFSCTDLLPESQQFRESVESLKAIKPMKVPIKNKEKNEVKQKNTFLHFGGASSDSIVAEECNKSHYQRASSDPITLKVSKSNSYIFDTSLKTVNEELSMGFSQSIVTVNTLVSTDTPYTDLNPLSHQVSHPYGAQSSMMTAMEPDGITGQASILSGMEPEGEEWALLTNEPNDWESGYPFLESPQSQPIDMQQNNYVPQNNTNKKNSKSQNSRESNGKGKDNNTERGKGKGKNKGKGKKEM